MIEKTTMPRRKFLSTAAVVSGISLSGCAGGSELQVIDQRYKPHVPQGWGIWFVEMKNAGSVTNVEGRVDLISTSGSDEGEVLETYYDTDVIEGGKTDMLTVKHKHYLNTDTYDFARSFQPTDRPYAEFSSSKVGGAEVRLDARSSRSVDGTISSYEWWVAEYADFRVGEGFGWDVRNGEVVEFFPPVGEDADLFGKFVCRVTDQEGRTDVAYGGRLSIDDGEVKVS